MTSPLFDDLPLWVYPLVLVVFVGPTSVYAYNKVRDYRNLMECTDAATEWEKATANGQPFRPDQTTSFAKLYAAYRHACPGGSMVVDERQVPQAIKDAARIYEKK